MNYYQIPPQELGKDAKIPLLCLADSGEVFYELALEMINEIKANNVAGKNTVFICPVGPVGQYPIFTRLVNRDRISLKNCWFINMDEYLNDDDSYLDESNPLSFRGFMNRNVYGKIDAELLLPVQQRIFPNPADTAHIQNLIQELGGVDICFGGIGINGHMAFNEPEDVPVEEFAARQTRVLHISRETRTINSVGDRNGAIEAMPTRCVTIGMREILSARKIRLGVFRDWHRSVVRRAAYGAVTAEFPVTICQSHPDTLIIANSNAAQQPF